MAIGFGSIVSIALNVISHREQIKEIIEEVQALWVKIRAILEKAAPDLLPDAPPLPIEAQPEAEGFSMTWLQESLNKLQDAGLEVDGEYGPSTAKAITEFQQEYGLVADGWAGPTTTAKILELLSAKK